MARDARLMMGRVAAGAMLALSVLGACGCSLMTPTLDEAVPVEVDQQIDDALLVTPGTLTVAVDSTDAPQAMVASDGSIVGYDVDVARLVAERLGLDLAVVSASSPAAAFEDGDADVFLGATTDQQDDSVTVMGDYLENATAVFTVADEGTIVTADELAQGIIGVQGESASQEALARAGVIGEQETYANVNECFEALDAGAVDYVVCDATAGAYLARAYPGVRFAGTLSGVDAFGFAVDADAADLGEAVFDALDALIADGSLDAVHAAWYGATPFSMSDQTVTGVTVSAVTGDDADAEEGTGDINSL